MPSEKNGSTPSRVRRGNPAPGPCASGHSPLVTVPGPPPAGPYHAAMADPGDLATLRERLRAARTPPPPPGPVLAAVLVPLVPRPEGWALVFTRRTDDLSRHRGEISFPGGRVDPGEDSWAAALREADEELGIDAGAVERLGPLPRVLTRVSNYVVQPWAGVVPAAPFRPNPREVAEVIEVPLAALRAAGARREQRIIRGGTMAMSPAFDAGPVTIWGVTGTILAGLIAEMG